MRHSKTTRRYGIAKIKLLRQNERKKSKLQNRITLLMGVFFLSMANYFRMGITLVASILFPSFPHIPSSIEHRFIVRSYPQRTKKTIQIFLSDYLRRFSIFWATFKYPVLQSIFVYYDSLFFLHFGGRGGL